MSGVLGSFDALKQLRERMRGLTDGTFARKLSTKLAETAVSEVHRGFDQQRAPDGTPWKRSQRAIRENGQTLRDRGRLRNGFSRQNVTGAGFDIVNNVEYAAVHQNGAIIQQGPRTQVLTFGPARKRTVISFDADDMAVAARVGGRGMRFTKATARNARFSRKVQIGERIIVIPARPMLPSGTDIGPIWRRAFTDTANEAMRRQMGP